MRQRLTVMAAAVTGLALIAGGATTAAQAQAPASSWQVSDVITAEPLSNLYAVTALSPDDAWAAGQGGASGDGTVLMHWNGNGWADRTPASATPGQIVALGMSSPDNVWAATDYDYALRWNGHSWTKFPFHAVVQLGGLAVISPDDVWVLGAGPTRPFVRNFNGRSWRNVKSPIVPVEVSAVSARDIWTAGNRPGSLSTTLADWTGRSWRSLSLPDLHLAPHQSTRPMDITAFSRADVWVAARIIGGPARQQWSVLLHWNGRGWHAYRSPVGQVTGVASDGHGGFWLTADPGSPGRADLLHYAYGRWAAVVPAPQPDGQPADFSSLWGVALIPGTTSVWAVGNVAEPDSLPNGLIVRYAP